jgi:sulfite reductase (NADPH) flavoprotein alpha-component
MPERMALAEGKPLPRRLFAAMAQQDCGQCGYLCETYSAAIASGQEAKLNLCVPGGKETSRALKRLLEAAPDRAPAPAPLQTRPPEPKAPAPCSREAPVEAIFRSATRLNTKSSVKDTRHIVFDVAGSGLAYAPGDSFGLYPKNDRRWRAICAACAEAPATSPLRGADRGLLLSRAGRAV